MQCPYCGDQHSDQTRFCPKTGIILNQPDICQHCGATLPLDVSFCPMCGTAKDASNSHFVQFNLYSSLRQPRIQLALFFCVILTIGITAIISNSVRIRPIIQQPPNGKTDLPKATYALQLETPSLSPSPIFFSVPTNTPTRKPTITPTKEGPWMACQDSYLSRLHVDDKAYVSHQPPLANRVRLEPSLDSKIVGYIQPGEYIKILKGPTCANQWVWWYVRADKASLQGWTSEGDIESYWLNPSP